MSYDEAYKKRVEESLARIPCQKLKTMQDIANIITEQKKDEKTGRCRSGYIYRGLLNEKYSLLTSLQRNCREKQGELEKSILRSFAKYAIAEEPQINESVWRQMVIGQHHGLPTRLLDWSYSPLVALHFATSGGNLTGSIEHDSVVWRIDIEEIHALLPEKYKEVLNSEDAYAFTVDMLERVAKNLAEYDNDMMDNSLAILEPPSIDQRIVNQYSYFSVIPQKIVCLEEFLAHNTKNTVRYIIDKDIFWCVRDMLDQANMNERIIYPGLDGLAAWLKRYYFVI